MRYDTMYCGRRVEAYVAVVYAVIADDPLVCRVGALGGVLFRYRTYSYVRWR